MHASIVVGAATIAASRSRYVADETSTTVCSYRSWTSGLSLREIPITCQPLAVSDLATASPIPSEQPMTSARFTRAVYGRLLPPRVLLGDGVSLRALASIG